MLKNILLKGLKFLGKSFYQIIMIIIAVCIGMSIYTYYLNDKIIEIKENNTVTLADLSEYTNATINDEHFIQSSISKMSTQIKDKNTTALFFVGYASCAYCQYALPILQKVANDEDITVMYVSAYYEDVKNDELEILLEQLGDYVEYSTAGFKTMKVPYVLAVKNGQIISKHSKLVDNIEEQDGVPILTDEQQQEIYDIYDEMAQAIK